MPLYKDKKTGRRHRTVDGSRQDARLAAADGYELVEDADEQRAAGKTSGRKGSKTEGE
ncbi:MULTISPECIES: hypothetical protein [unclassified Egicoccus]|uniref:hypothetical protein n=1 Tax=unclassified Egicoccus TaxID=2635606 RepID=UPI00359EFCDD